MKQQAKKRSAPKHLKPSTRAWWQRVEDTWQLEEHHLRLLTLAAEAWDRCQQAREILQRKGLIYQDRFGQPSARPEVAIERDSRLAFARLLKALDFGPQEPKELPGRPSQLV